MGFCGGVRRDPLRQEKFGTTLAPAYLLLGFLCAFLQSLVHPKPPLLSAPQMHQTGKVAKPRLAGLLPHL